MQAELPVFQRCCFCLPLRYGLLTWGYFRLALSLFFVIVMSIAFYGMLDASIRPDSFPLNMVSAVIIGILLLLTITDVVFNILFIVGGHKKNLRLLRVYYVYSFVLCILTSLMGIAYAVWTVLFFRFGEIDTTFHIWIILLDTATLLAQILAQVYALLLIRSEILKLKSHCQFRFVNNAAEAECTLKCEENVEEDIRPGYKSERYVPELH